MKKPNPPELETIAAKELEQQVNLQSVREMIIVEAEQGYQLHVPLRDFTGGRIREISGGKTVAELEVTKPRMRVLATRREQGEPRHYKKIETLHAYISETFPDVEMIQLKMFKPGHRRTTTDEDVQRQPGRRTKVKAAPPAPVKKTAKAVKTAAKTAKSR